MVGNCHMTPRREACFAISGRNRGTQWSRDEFGGVREGLQRFNVFHDVSTENSASSALLRLLKMADLGWGNKEGKPLCVCASQCVLILNHFFNFYILNMDISLCICFPMLKFCMFGHKVVLEETLSQIFDLGLRFYFRLKNG